MSALDPADVERFGKLLAMLASDYEGERASAARKATAFLRDRELRWSDITDQLRCPPIVYQLPTQPDETRLHQGHARRCLLSPVRWKPHEEKFLRQMAAQLRSPSPKQREWLDGLLDRSRRTP